MTQQQPPASLTTARIIALAMIGGVVMFWVIAWVISKGGTTPMAEDAGLGNANFAIWAALAFGGFAGALYMQRQAATAAEEASGRGEPIPAGFVQSRLIIAWALLEGPALFAGVVLLMWGMRLPLLINIPILLVGFAISFPRGEWFAA